MAEQQPMYRAFTVLERDGEAPFWLNIGVGFVHKDTRGLNVILQALPLDGKLVLRTYGEEPENSRPGRSSKVRIGVAETRE